MTRTPDYTRLIDAETQAFIRLTDSWYPPETAQQSIAEQRHRYNAMCREFHTGYPAGIVASDDAKLVATRRYECTTDTTRQTLAQIVYFHGGGFVVGGLESHDDVCAEICHATGFTLTAVDYRLCPEYPHPAAFDDAMAGVNKAWKERQLPIILCGDSAGGNLAAAITHKLRASSITLKGQVLIYPGLGGDTGAGSYLEHAHAPMLTTEEVEQYAAIRVGSQDDIYMPTMAPLCDTDFSGLPPTIIFSAECDPLSDDGWQYRDRLQQAGTRAFWLNETGLVHGYLRARHTVTRAQSSFSRITDAVSALGENRWPYPDN